MAGVEEEEDEDVFEDAVEEHNESKKQSSSWIPVSIEQVINRGLMSLYVMLMHP